MRRRIVQALLVLILAAAAGYLGVAAFVWVGQERLMFFPRPVASRPAPPRDWRLEEVSLTMRDGTRLAGVLVSPRLAKPPVVVYFGGNAEEVTAYAAHAGETYGERAVLLVNYRGYGESAGKPGEAAMVSDGLEVFDWAAQRGDLDASRIALHGRSLGSGVAVQVAAARPAACVVLTSPFASARAVAAELYPWLPISALMRHPFDSASRAPSIHAPALFLVGSADTVIAPRHSQVLAAAWGGPVTSVVLEGFGHNDLDLNPRYAEAIHAFLDRCQPASAGA